MLSNKSIKFYFLLILFNFYPLNSNADSYYKIVWDNSPSYSPTIVGNASGAYSSISGGASLTGQASASTYTSSGNSSFDFGQSTTRSFHVEKTNPNLKNNFLLRLTGTLNATMTVSASSIVPYSSARSTFGISATAGPGITIASLGNILDTEFDGNKTKDYLLRLQSSGTGYVDTPYTLKTTYTASTITSAWADASYSDPSGSLATYTATVEAISQ